MPVALAHETGQLGMRHLKQVWSVFDAQQNGEPVELDWPLVNAVFGALGLGLEPTFQFLFHQRPSFPEFESWILQNGMVTPEMIEYFNELVTRVESPTSEDEQVLSPPVLSEEDLQFWNENGYVIVRQAISPEACAETVALIYDFLGASPDDPVSWYQPHPSKQGIMVQLFKAEVLHRNRLSDRIRGAYEQLLQRQDLIVSMDRMSFNPPETDSYEFPGPNLHWDVSLKLPIPYGLQGLLYLTDTAANQGAFTLVPGFHHRIEEWLHQLPEGCDPRQEDLMALGAQPVVANAGDFIIWHHALPHGSAKNHAQSPRIVQYINYLPLTFDHRKMWR